MSVSDPPVSGSALVIGCGSIGSRHARNLANLGVDLSVFDVDAERRRELAAELDASAPASLGSAMNADLDFVVVATPTDKHVGPAIEAVRAGCDVFVEKPLSNDETGVVELLAAAEQRNAVTMIGSNFRFHPAVEAIREVVRAGRIGAPISARIEAGSYLPEWHPDEDYRELYAAKAGVGGALLDYVHELNYARWLFGEVEETTAMLGHESSLEIDTEDTASLLARFEGGVQCTFLLDYVQRPYRRSCHVVGEEGTVTWEWDSGVVRRYDPAAEEWIAEATVDDDWEVNRMYVDEMRHFLECVANREETRTPLEEGWRDLQFVLAAKRAAETGRHFEPGGLDHE